MFKSPLLFDGQCLAGTQQPSPVSIAPPWNVYCVPTGKEGKDCNDTELFPTEPFHYDGMVSDCPNWPYGFESPTGTGRSDACGSTPHWGVDFPIGVTKLASSRKTLTYRSGLCRVDIIKYLSASPSVSSRARTGPKLPEIDPRVGQLCFKFAGRAGERWQLESICRDSYLLNDVASSKDAIQD